MDCQPTRMTYQEMLVLVIDLGCWAPERSRGWRPTLRKGSDRSGPPFRGLYMNENEGRAYFTMLPICGLEPTSDLWCREPDYVSAKHRNNRRNVAPRDGVEQQALKQLLLGG